MDTRGFAQAVLFTGHMIDAPDRAEERFPARAEGAARAAIHRVVSSLAKLNTVGIAAGASGGDLLFHEVCAELAIPTRLYLALEPKAFVERSVAPAGKDWVRRYYALEREIGWNNIHVLDAAGGNVWEQVNLWMLEETVKAAPRRALVALWNGEGGDGPGGTQQLVDQAPQHGFATVSVIRTQDLLA